MNKVVTIIDKFLGAGDSRRTGTFPAVRTTEGRLWELRPKHEPVPAPQSKAPKA